MKKSKLIILLLFITLLSAFVIFDVQEYLNLAALKSQQDYFSELKHENAFLITLSFFIGYILITALSLPGAAILTLAAGAIFGLYQGLLIASFASSIGATLAFLASRYLFKEAVQAKFSNQLKAFNKGIEKDGAFYLFTLRLVPAFPFFVINLLMGLTPIKTKTYYLVSQIGMLAGTAVFVNAGTQLAKIDSLSGILSFDLFLSFALLGVLPIAAKKTIEAIKARNAFSHFKKPKHYDYNLVAIGAGAGGLVSTYIGAAVKAKVALIEKHKMGGDCLNTGCVPSKALIRSAHAAQEVKDADTLGISTQGLEVDFNKVFEGIDNVIKQVEPHDSVERYEGLGVECISGAATLLSPYEIEVDGKIITTKNIVIATGARPFIPNIKGLDKINYHTSDTIWSIRENPGRLIVLGGGPIGSELTQSFNRLGAKVTQIERGPRILPREDEDASLWVSNKFLHEGVNLLTNHEAVEVIIENGEQILICQTGDNTIKVVFDNLLIAVGRTPNTSGLGLEKLGIETQANGALVVDDFLRTNIPNIYGVGDVIGAYQFTHTAAHQAWFAAVNALFGSLKKFAVDYRVIPWATFTDPEVARVGVSEDEANANSIPYELVKFDLEELDRAIADRHTDGFVKVLTVPGKDKILGVTIVGNQAGDLIAEYVQAMKYGLGLNKVLGTIHIYPTMAEANKYAAGEWKRAHIPEKIMKWLKRFHNWRRG
ncbi:Pyruvate/2-oxoglutarate dehydrogenase complex dihydrolipoamidedehydrogenase (E3) component and related enzyme [Marinomonas sp. MED121]|uniref:FAD-dependent oxidoreductase n=1 Tax=Marinomonas sp. MED121 TaxID=314277 RepID=UPI000069059D|nr:FAD-dependent oxidoreductase [Marinomonas sp. MED121]EAQ63607.1 Pyruvate/2-oxoglutarate dehydrogenase complex dihydrolipoamidedehydrogenase (E3) component and related enzyme [Marinomonas sp. MED121]